jgi:hypothetical protein
MEPNRGRGGDCGAKSFSGVESPRGEDRIGAAPDLMSPSLPLMASYLGALPDGPASHPQCSVKASVVRHAIESRPLGPGVRLPGDIRALVDQPPPVSAWVPEVHFNAVMLAIRDVHFDGGEAFHAWVYEQNKRLFSTPLYRAIFLVLSPERLMRGMGQRWAAFRRGTTANARQRAPKDLELRVHAPPHLYDAATVGGMSAALRAAIACAGAVHPEVEASLLSPIEVVYRLRWK